MPVTEPHVIVTAMNGLTKDSQETAFQSQGCHFERADSCMFRDVLQSDHFIDSDTVITVCKEMELRDRAASEQGRSDDDTSGISVEGSPLKLETFHVPAVGGIKHERLVKALSASEARAMLSSYSKSTCGKKEESAPPVFVYCDGDGPEALAFLGLLSQHSQTEECQRCTTYKISSKGPFSYELRDKLPKVASLVKKHFPHSTKVTTRYKAEYDVIGVQIRDISILDQLSSLTLKLEWERSTALLQAPPLDSITVVEAVVSTGDMRSAAHVMYTELTVLQGFVAGLKDGLVKWAASSSDVPLVDRVANLVEEVKRGSGYRRNANLDDDAETQTLALSNLVFETRQDFDFTEQLWNVLKDCSSYTDLVRSMQFVFNQLEQGHLQPMVHKSNRCQFAELIRASYHGEMTSPDLQGCEPLELLAEIGIEKLQRDYMNAFIGKDLAAASHLQHFVRPCETLDERVVLLDKLQHTLELVAMLAQYLNLPRTTLGITARRTLKYYEAHDIDESQVFTVPVSTNNIYSHVERSQPRFWKVEMISEVKGPTACANYVITSKPTFSHTAAHSSGIEPESMEEEETEYFYLTEASRSTVSI